MARKSDEFPTELGAVRDQIDIIDEQIVELLNKRIRLALAAGSAKLMEGLMVNDDAREQDVLTHVYKVNEGPLPDDDLIGFYLHFMQVSRRIQQNVRENPDVPLGKTQPAVDWYVPSIDQMAAQARRAESA